MFQSATQGAILGGLMVAMLSGPALAKEAPAGECSAFSFVSAANAFKEGVLIGEKDQKIAFQSSSDGPACPDENFKICPRKRYLIPGNKVILNGLRHGAFACAWYYSESAKKQMMGWVPETHLTIPPAESSEAGADWVGKWEPVGNPDLAEMDFKAEGSKLSFSGSAVSGNSGAFGPNTGTVEGDFEPKSKAVHLDGDSTGTPGCDLDLVSLSPWLVVRDNGACGGMNVSFDGIYRKK